MLIGETWCAAAQLVCLQERAGFRGAPGEGYPTQLGEVSKSSSRSKGRGDLHVEARSGVFNPSGPSTGVAESCFSFLPITLEGEMYSILSLVSSKFVAPSLSADASYSFDSRLAIDSVSLLSPSILVLVACSSSSANDFMGWLEVICMASRPGIRVVGDGVLDFIVCGGAISRNSPEEQ